MEKTWIELRQDESRFVSFRFADFTEQEICPMCHAHNFIRVNNQDDCFDCENNQDDYRAELYAL